MFLCVLIVYALSIECIYSTKKSKCKYIRAASKLPPFLDFHFLCIKIVYALNKEHIYKAKNQSINIYIYKFYIPAESESTPYLDFHFCLIIVKSIEHN